MKMIEVDENDKIETVNLDLDQGDCVGHIYISSTNLRYNPMKLNATIRYLSRTNILCAWASWETSSILICPNILL